MIPELNVSRSCLQGPSFSLLLAALAAVLSLSASAHASNLVADSGFEAAGGNNVYFAGQSIDGGSWTVAQGAVFIDNQDPWVFDGNNSVNLSLANPFVANSLAQTLTTVVGQAYLVNFWGNADTPNTFSVTENGTALGGTPGSIAQNGFPNTTNSSLFTDYSGQFVATSTTTTLDFTSTGDPAIGSQDGSVMIDDVSVQTASTLTPEPGSIFLTLTGVIGLGLAVGRKRLGRSVFAS
jgi:hypothetical protein